MFEDELWLDPHYSLSERARNAVLVTDDNASAVIFVRIDLPRSATNSSDRAAERNGLWLFWNSPKAHVVRRNRSHTSRTLDREVGAAETPEIDELIARNRCWSLAKIPVPKHESEAQPRPPPRPEKASHGMGLRSGGKGAAWKYIGSRQGIIDTFWEPPGPDPRDWVQGSVTLVGIASRTRYGSLVIRNDRRLWHDLDMLFPSEVPE
jgi:hypothetical protein